MKKLVSLSVLLMSVVFFSGCNAGVLFKAPVCSTPAVTGLVPKAPTAQAEAEIPAPKAPVAKAPAKPVSPVPKLAAKSALKAPPILVLGSGRPMYNIRLINRTSYEVTILLNHGAPAGLELKLKPHSDIKIQADAGNTKVPYEAKGSKFFAEGTINLEPSSLFYTLTLVPVEK